MLTAGFRIQSRRAACWLARAVVVLAATTMTRAQAPSTAVPPPPALAARVTAFFTAWQGRDLGAMYEFYCAPYRGATPRADYLRLTRLLRFPILEFRVTGADVSGARATVRIHLKNDTVPTQAGVMDSDTTQIWITDASGMWCKENEPLVMPFPGAR